MNDTVVANDEYRQLIGAKQKVVVLESILSLADNLIDKCSPLVHCLGENASTIQKDAAKCLKMAKTDIETARQEIKNIDQG